MEECALGGDQGSVSALERELGMTGSTALCPSGSREGHGADASPSGMNERRALGYLAIIGSTTSIIPLRYLKGIHQCSLDVLGLERPRQAMGYENDREWKECVRTLVSQKYRIVTGDVLAPDELPKKAQLVSHGLVSSLNDKAKLNHYLSSSLLPHRTVLTREQLCSYRLDNPVFLKVAGAKPTSAGVGVSLIRSARQVRAFIRRFPGRSTFVVEEAIHSQNTRNIQFVVRADTGEVRFLGVSTQRLTSGVLYAGSVVDRNARIERSLYQKLYKATAKIAAQGYVGVVGYDVLKAKSGRDYVVDLNARLNASTGLLIAAPYVLRALSANYVEPILVKISEQSSGGVTRAPYFMPICSFADSCNQNYSFGYLIGESSNDLRKNKALLVEGLQ